MACWSSQRWKWQAFRDCSGIVGGIYVKMESTGIGVAAMVLLGHARPPLAAPLEVAAVAVSFLLQQMVTICSGCRQCLLAPLTML